MKISKSKQQQFFDNPETLRRELYRNGVLITSWSRDQLDRMRVEDRTIPAWGIHNDKPNNQIGGE